MYLPYRQIVDYTQSLVTQYSIAHLYCARTQSRSQIPRSQRKDFPQAIKLGSEMNARFLSKFGVKILLVELKVEIKFCCTRGCKL